MPLHSKKEVRRAGQALVSSGDGEEAQWALNVVDYWRAIHFEALDRLLGEAKAAAAEVPGLLIAGRIKKLNTIIDKMGRPGNVKDLDTMFDIAGCRIVVQTPQERDEVVAKALESPYCVREQTRDYIARPKRDGYRGVHVIYRFDDLQSGHKLRGELQIRTEMEHAWATAVEMHDAAAKTRLKFENDDSLPYMFFNTASHIIEMIENGEVVDARKVRAQTEKLSGGRTFLEVVETLKEANDAAFLLGADVGFTAEDYCLLDFLVEEQILRIMKLDEEGAIKAYFTAESILGEDSHDMVLTRGFSLEGLRRLYPNYFGNIGKFIGVVEKYMECFF